MAKQIVVIGNRVVAHGTDCFADIGGAVVCLTNGKVYAGASIVECSTECPADIDTVGYEYHAGVFVKCAPFNKGDGTVAGWCDDCKAPIDTGFPSQFLGKVYCTTYPGNGSNIAGVTCGFRPKYAIITGKHYVNSFLYSATAIVTENGGLSFCVATDSNAVGTSLTPTITDDGISWVCSTTTTGTSVPSSVMNVAGVEYSVIVVG